MSEHFYRRRIMHGLMVISVGIFGSACANVEYMSNGDLRNFTMPDGRNYHEVLSGQGRPYGALVMGPHSTQNPNIFVLRRQNSKMMAETLLVDNSKDEKAMFERSTFAFGANDDSFGVRFRFIY